MDSSKKLYIALGLLVLLGGALYLQNKKEVAEERAYSYEAKTASLPTLSIDEETRKAIDTIELVRPPESEEKKDDEAAANEAQEPGKPESVTLKKKGEDSWELTSPVTYAANNSNVKSLLDNLDKLKVSEQISTTATEYDKWGLTDEKALHAVFKKGDQVVLDAYFGDNGSRGQMVRLAGKDGVFAIKGYSKFLYSRDTAGWRDKSILKFEDKDVVKVTVENENGVFDFDKVSDKWQGKHKGKEIPDFKPSKVDDLVRAFKGLNASDFGDGKTAADVGLDKPLATVTVELTGGSAKHVISFGSTSEGNARWISTNSSPQIFSVSSWTADWAMAEPSKFQEPKKDDKKDTAKPSAPSQIEDESEAMP
jgi:hypothetical protein